MYTQEEIIKELKSLDIADNIDYKIDKFFHNRVSFKLKVKPKKKKTKYTLEVYINKVSDYNDKELLECLAYLLTKSEDLNYSFLLDKKDTDKEKNIYFIYCSYKNFLSNFTGEINNREYGILSNYLNNTIDFVKSLDNSLGR